jgi:hypothetical protein
MNVTERTPEQEARLEEARAREAERIKRIEARQRAAESIPDLILGGCFVLVVFGFIALWFLSIFVGLLMVVLL